MNKDYPRIQLLTIEQLLENLDNYSVPPGGDFRTAERYQAKGSKQNDIFSDK